MKKLADLCKLYAKKYDITSKEATATCESVIELLVQELIKNKKDINIKNFGKFKHKTVPQKNVIHPKTGEKMVIPEKHIVKFTVAQ